MELEGSPGQQTPEFVGSEAMNPGDLSPLEQVVYACVEGAFSFVARRERRPREDFIAPPDLPVVSTFGMLRELECANEV